MKTKSGWKKAKEAGQYAIHPNEIERAIRYAKAGEYRKALHLLEAALVLQPRDPELLYHASYCYWGLHDYRQCISHVKKAIALNPGKLALYLIGATAYQAVGDFHHAINMLEGALKIEPGAHDLWVNMAECLHNLGLFDEALEVLEAVANAGFETAVSLQLTGRCQLELGTAENRAKACQNFLDLVTKYTEPPEMIAEVEKLIKEEFHH
jgi:tetratricopeptide (TPR) repeat protein